MKKQTREPKRLELSRETIAKLSPAVLSGVAGAHTEWSHCWCGIENQSD